MTYHKRNGKTNATFAMASKVKLKDGSGIY